MDTSTNKNPTPANHKVSGSTATAGTASGGSSSGRKFSWVKRLMKNNNNSNSADRYSNNTKRHQHQRSQLRKSAATLDTTLREVAAANTPPLTAVPDRFNSRQQPISSQFDPTSYSTSSLHSSMTDQVSRIPILSVSSQSMVSSSMKDDDEADDSQQSTTATSILPTMATGHHNHNHQHTHHTHHTHVTHGPNQSSHYIHLNAMHNHNLDDSSIVTLLSSNRRCRSFDSNTNLSTLGIPPLSIIERQQISLNNEITSPNSPVLSGQTPNARSSTISSLVGVEVGSITTS